MTEVVQDVPTDDDRGVVPIATMEEPPMCTEDACDNKNHEMKATNTIQDAKSSSLDGEAIKPSPETNTDVIHCAGDDKADGQNSEPLDFMTETVKSSMMKVLPEAAVVEEKILELESPSSTPQDCQLFPSEEMDCPTHSLDISSTKDTSVEQEIAQLSAIQISEGSDTFDDKVVLCHTEEEEDFTEHREQDPDFLLMLVSPQPTLAKKSLILEPSPTSVLDNVIPFSNHFPTPPESNFHDEKEEEPQQEAAKWDQSIPSELDVSESSNKIDTSFEIVGTVTPFSDFLTQQNMLKKQQRQRERQARESLHTIAPEPSRSMAVSPSKPEDCSPAGMAGIVMSRADFERHQRQLEAARRQQERQAREQLHRPARNTEESNCCNTENVQEHDNLDPLNSHICTTNRTIPDVDAWGYSPSASSTHEEYLAQDAASRVAAELKRLAQEQKKKELEAREIMDSFRYHPDAVDAATRIAGELKKLSLEQKQKEQEAKVMVASYRFVEDGADISTRLATDLKRLAQEQKQKEREAREMVASYRVSDDGAVDAASRLAADLKRMAQEQKQKEREAKEMVASYRIVDGGAVDAASRLAAEMKRLGLEQKQKEKEARELVASYRIVDDSAMDAATRVAADLKRLANEQRQKEREAREMVASYRHGDAKEGDVATRLAADLKRLAQEQKQKEKEARDMVYSYRRVDNGTGDAASRVAMNLRQMSQEQKRKEKEAKEMITSYRQSHCGAGDAADLVAAKLKQISQEQKQKEREAKEYASSFCLVDLEARTPAEKMLLEERRKRKALAEEKLRQMENSADNDENEPLNNLAGIQNRKAAELLAVEEERKKNGTVPDFRDSESALEQIRLQTTAELLAVAASGNRAKSIADEFDRGIKTQAVDEIKSRMAAELNAIEEERNKKNDDLVRSPCCNALEQIQSQKAAELAALMERCANAQQIAEEFQRAVQSTVVHDIKLRTAAELAVIEERKKNETAFESCDSISVLEQIQSRKARELAILEESWTSKLIADEFARTGPSKADEIKSRTAAELSELQGKSARMKEEFSFHITKDNTDIIKSKTLAELSTLKGKSTSMKSQFVQSTSKSAAEEIKLQTALELSSLQGRSCDIKNLLKQNASRSSADTIKAKTAAELMALKENGTKQLASTFVIESKNSRLDKLKSKTAAELSILQQKGMGAKSIKEEIICGQKNERLERLKSQTHAELSTLKGKSAKERAEEFGRIQDGKVKSIKQQTAAELAAVKIAQEQRKKLAEEEASRSSDSVKENHSIASSFSADELAAFEKERKEMERQLEEMRRNSAHYNNLSTIHAQRSKELKTLIAKKMAKKTTIQSRINGTGKNGGLVLNSWMDSELEKLKLERMQREREIEELKARSAM